MFSFEISENIEEKFDGPIQCYKCGETFDELPLVKEHVKNAHGVSKRKQYGKPRDHQCHVCHAMYETEEKLNNHMCSYTFNSSDKVGENKCQICDIEFKNREKLSSHNLAFHVTEKRFECDQCNFKAKVARSLTLHKKRKHQKIKEDICYICGKAFADAASLKGHMKARHLEEPRQYVCDKCGATYPFEMSLRRHVSLKHPVYYLCTCCEKLFTSLKKLKVHLLNDHNIKSGSQDIYVCFKCQKCCASSKELDDHYFIDHQMPRGDEFKCTTCKDKSFASRITLKMHLMESHEFNPIEDVSYKSEFANAMSEDASQAAQTLALKSMHVVADSNLKGVRCDVCGRMMSCNRSLSDHKRQVHDKANHIKCDLCPFTTFQPYMLKKHKLRQHDKSVKYDCDQCSFTCFNKNGLMGHKKRMHFNIRPQHKCTECDSTFDAKYKLAVHMLREHNIVYKYK